MNAKKARDIAFYLHRYLGLVVGLILIVVGLTGSLLVFHGEIESFLVGRQFGRTVPQTETVSIERILNNVTTAYQDRPELKLYSIGLDLSPDLPLRVDLQSPDDQWTEVFVDRYTGKVLGDRPWEKTFYGIVYPLHYELLAGNTGMVIVGIAALFLIILSITGLILWPGWRRLIAGFKIRWKAHPKRVNFDIHKVAGIISVVFLTLIAFTGFCWNFYEQTEPMVYAATFTPKPVEPTSQVIPGKKTMQVTEILQRADAALPEGETTQISLPLEPEGVYRIRKKVPQDSYKRGMSFVYLDRYTGEVLRVKDVRSLSRADAILDSFIPMHYGTFGGLPTRLLYVFVGLSPVILFITGLVMYRFRRRKVVTKTSRELIER